MLDTLTDWLSEVVQSMSSDARVDQQVQHVEVAKEKRVSKNNNNGKIGIDNPGLILEELEDIDGEVTVVSWSCQNEVNSIEVTDDRSDEVDACVPDDSPMTPSELEPQTPTKYSYKIPGWFDPTNSEGVRGDDVSLAEQGMTRGSTGSLEYHDDPEEIREEGGDEAYLVTAGEPEPVPEDVLNYQESAPTIGQLEVIFDYNGDGNRMNITIIKGLGLPTKENGGASAWRLRIMLYPKKQRTKTRIRESEEPVFKELFRFTRIRPHELVNSAIRFRLYGAERMRKERLIGEGLVKFSSLNTSSKESVIVNLVSRSEAVGGGTASPYSSNSDLSASGESNASLQSLAHGGLPELLVGLTYNATTGRLAVELIKGSHFKQHAAGRAPDSYVRIALMSSSGFEMTKSKTSVRRGQPNPTFKETFIFQVAQFQLADVTLMFSVFNKRGMKRKETIGWFTMGLSNSSDEETAHWKEMRESKGHQVCRWHAMSDK
ncbi:synaptotagmin-16-like isoform X5 [Asterias rubens]|uniref:synaptotagmin-16-like isoform X5 n=1 Tax=Asterias rubens TaxID=7604 RepID=UPI001455BB31|nr:synaptotagmin-16-like isoform X5 [Asterias rubens]